MTTSAPARRRSTTGGLTGSQGRKSGRSTTESGSARRLSSVTSTRAATVSPKRTMRGESAASAWTGRGDREEAEEGAARRVAPSSPIRRRLPRGRTPHHRPGLATRRRASAQERKEARISVGALEEMSTGSTPSPRKPPRRWASRASFACRRASTSRRVRMTGLLLPVAGSRKGTTRPATSGKLCSQVGSWITTGTRSSPRSSRGSQTSSLGGGKKSERTKTNDPAVTDRRCCTRRARARSSQSGGPDQREQASRSSPALARRRSPWGGRHKVAPSTWST